MPHNELPPEYQTATASSHKYKPSCSAAAEDFTTSAYDLAAGAAAAASTTKAN